MMPNCMAARNEEIYDCCNFTENILLTKSSRRIKSHDTFALSYVFSDEKLRIETFSKEASLLCLS